MKCIIIHDLASCYIVLWTISHGFSKYTKVNERPWNIFSFCESLSNILAYLENENVCFTLKALEKNCSLKWNLDDSLNHHEWHGHKYVIFTIITLQKKNASNAIILVM